MKKTVTLQEIEVGETFKVGDYEFIKFYDKHGKTAVVTKDEVFCSGFGENNDLTHSVVLEKLQKEFLPEIEKQIGADSICEFETDLTTLDGLKPYPHLKSKVSLPTLDFYCQNASVFDKYKLDKYWWLATPESALPHDDPWWTLCVSPSGYISVNCYDVSLGVRPILCFVSTIFVSCDE